jgi:hypothetical protein
MLAVLDLKAEALAVETKLHASRSQASPAVEAIDRASWLAAPGRQRHDSR